MTRKQQTRDDLEFLESLQERFYDIHGRYDGDKITYIDFYSKKPKTIHLADSTGALVDALSDAIGDLQKYVD